MSELNGSTWVRWGLGIVASMMGVMCIAFASWIVGRMDGIEAVLDERKPIIQRTAIMTDDNRELIKAIEDRQRSVLEAIAVLRQEVALLSQRFDREYGRDVRR